MMSSAYVHRCELCVYSALLSSIIQHITLGLVIITLAVGLSHLSNRKAANNAKKQ